MVNIHLGSISKHLRGQNAEFNLDSEKNCEFLACCA